MLAPLVVPAPAVAASLAAFIAFAWWINRWLESASLLLDAPVKVEPRQVERVGRHRIDGVNQPYRPRPAPPVVPGSGPLTATERAERMVPMPVDPPAWRSDVTEVLPAEWPTTDAPGEPSAPGTPDDWFGCPTDETRVLDTLQ